MRLPQGANGIILRPVDTFKAQTEARLEARCFAPEISGHQCGADCQYRRQPPLQLG